MGLEMNVRTKSGVNVTEGISMDVRVLFLLHDAQKEISRTRSRSRRVEDDGKISHYRKNIQAIEIIKAAETVKFRRSISISHRVNFSRP